MTASYTITITRHRNGIDRSPHLLFFIVNLRCYLLTFCCIHSESPVVVWTVHSRASVIPVAGGCWARALISWAVSRSVTVLPAPCCGFVFKIPCTQAPATASTDTGGRNATFSTPGVLSATNCKTGNDNN